jgi:CheY-like chemotaxis protein
MKCPAPTPGEPIRVVLAEDHQDTREAYTLILRRAGIEVDPVDNGRDAVIRATEAPPDVVILDFWMPVVGGAEATAAIRANPATARVPVVLMSAALGPYVQQQAEAAGCDVIRAKPLQPRELVSIVEDLTRKAGPG